MNTENPSTRSDLEAKRQSFEKTRFDYCSKMFENEASRKQNLETKAQFYLTFVTVFLTAIYFSLPYLTALQGIMNSKMVSPTWKGAITILLIGLGIALLFSLIAVLFAMKIQNYKTEYPTRPYSSLFVPNPDNFEEENEADMLHYTARIAIEALEKNKDYNDKKARWVEATSYVILFAVIILALLVGISVYLQVYVLLPTPAKP
jgi:uncharacterized membrane protein (DUF485 family)